MMYHKKVKKKPLFLKLKLLFKKRILIYDLHYANQYVCNIRLCIAVVPFKALKITLSQAVC